MRNTKTESIMQTKPQPVRTLKEYYNECIHMLNCQPGNYHIGSAQREIIAMCHALKRPIQNCVALLMRIDNS